MMPASVTFARQPASVRRTARVICALLLLAGAVEVHPAREAAFEPLAAGDGQVYVCVDGHPSTFHVEAALAVDRHQCPACRYQLQTSGGDLSTASSLAAPAPSGLPSAAAGPPPIRRAGSTRGARAPPLS
jgi:hypothetical protein